MGIGIGMGRRGDMYQSSGERGPTPVPFRPACRPPCSPREKGSGFGDHRSLAPRPRRTGFLAPRNSTLLAIERTANPARTFWQSAALCKPGARASRVKSNAELLRMCMSGVLANAKRQPGGAAGGDTAARELEPPTEQPDVSSGTCSRAHTCIQKGGSRPRGQGRARGRGVPLRLQGRGQASSPAAHGHAPRGQGHERRARNSYKS
eukprot:357788-Chlamydomonas_euryale.AAC.5